MSVWTDLTPQERARLHACADCQQPLPFDSGGYDTRRDLWGHSDRGNPIPTGGYVCDACWPPHRDRLDRVAAFRVDGDDLRVIEQGFRDALLLTKSAARANRPGAFNAEMRNLLALAREDPALRDAIHRAITDRNDT